MIQDIKNIGVLVAIISGIASSFYVSKLENHPWYLWVLAWLWFPLCIGAFLLGITIYERALDRGESQKHLQRQKDRHKRRHQKKP